jgi:transposase-like protein
MNSHKNAPLTPKGREAMVRSVTEGGLSQAAAARQFNVTAKIVAKWVNRFHAEGVEGLRDRSSRPHSLPSQTEPATCAMVEALRRQRHTGKQIATELKISPATVSRILCRLRLNRIRDLERVLSGNLEFLAEARCIRRAAHVGIGLDRRRVGRPEAVVHASGATAAGPRPTIRRDEVRAVRPDPHPAVFAMQRGSGLRLATGAGNVGSGLGVEMR